MLGSIKEKTKGWVAYLIVGLITIPFALFGINEYFTGASNVVVASINDNDITQEEFMSEFQPQQRRLQQNLAEKYDNEFDAVLKQSVLNQMIDRRLLDNLAKELSYATTAGELSAIISTNDLFIEDGKFSIDRYKQLLRLNGYTTKQYEDIKAKELTQNQIKYNLLDSAFVVPSQLDRLKELNDQQRQFNYIVLEANNYTDKVKVEEKSVKDYYSNQKESFFAPEQVKIEFVELTLDGIAKGIEVNDDDLFNFYKDEKSRFITEEQRKAQHILVEDEVTANKVYDLLAKGGDFAKLASEYSQDPGSKDNGGDLGFFTKGVMTGEFENQVFSMSVDEISAPTKTEFGYHIIKLTAIQAGEEKDFNSVKAEVTELYTKAQAQKSLYKLTEQLENLAYEASLEEISDQMDLKLQTSELFTRNTQKLNQKIVSAAFSNEVLNKGENSTVIELSNEKLMVLRLVKKIPQRQKTFDEVKGEINTHLGSLLAKTFVNNVAKQIVKDLSDNNHEAVKALMTKNNLKWENVGWVGRDSNKADSAIIDKVFSLSKPEKSNTYSAQSLTKRSSVVLDLSAVKVENSKTSSADLERSILSFESNEVFTNILKSLRNQADIQIFSERL